MNNAITKELAEAIKWQKHCKEVFERTSFKCHRWDLEEANERLADAQTAWLAYYEESNLVDLSKIRS